MANHKIDIEFELDHLGRKLWHHSEFPHPLITVDYKTDGMPYHIVVVGSHCWMVARAYAEGGSAVDVVNRIKIGLTKP
jgi:hypothetical protein